MRDKKREGSARVGASWKQAINNVSNRHQKFLIRNTRNARRSLRLTDTQRCEGSCEPGGGWANKNLASTLESNIKILVEPITPRSEGAVYDVLRSKASYALEFIWI